MIIELSDENIERLEELTGMSIECEEDAEQAIQIVLELAD